MKYELNIKKVQICANIELISLRAYYQCVKVLLKIALIFQKAKGLPKKWFVGCDGLLIAAKHCT